MGYAAQIILPANTPVSSPVELEIVIAPCIVRKVTVTHPTGCASLVGIWFEYRSARLWPVKDNTYYLGNGSPITIYPDTILDQPPLVLTIKGYNSDDTYIHRPLIELDVDFIIGTNEVRTTSLLKSLRSAFGLDE